MIYFHDFIELGPLHCFEPLLVGYVKEWYHACIDGKGSCASQVFWLERWWSLFKGLFWSPSAQGYNVLTLISLVIALLRMSYLS